MSLPTNDDIRIQMERLSGKIDNLTVVIEAGDRHTQQLVELQKGEARHLAQAQVDDRQRHHDEIREIRNLVTIIAEKADTGISKVRTDSKLYVDERMRAVDSRFGELEPKVDALRLNWAKLTGIATILSVVTSTVVGFILKAMA